MATKHEGFSAIVMKVHMEDIMVPLVPHERYLIQDFIGRPFTKMHKVLSRHVTLAKDQVIFLPKMKCHKIFLLFLF
ncbi:hypothetical protein HanHA300_Chr08g0292981 [Helianthus annuus]|nr:hypothetical protein HanHA300_Chr08g0292981 [Helianthus annuus]